MLAKFINEGMQEHKDIGIFIREFRTTNELLLKEQNNLLSELKIKVHQLSMVMSDVLFSRHEVKGVTTRGGKMTYEVTYDKETNKANDSDNEPSGFQHYEQEKPQEVEGAFPAAYFAKRWQERNDLAQTYLNNLKAWPGLKEEESQPCRKADRRVGWSGMRSYGKEYITASLIREFLMIAVFRMLDPLLFYVLPESVLIPMLCGAEHLIFAGIKLFLCRGLVQ
ncbi:putative NADH:ubiquinone reductase [Tanacetum coccineum]